MHQFVPGCCCGCLVFSDNFNRGALGGMWQEIVGNWGIVSEALVEDHSATGGTPNARLIGTMPIPKRSAPAMRASIKVNNPTINDIFYLYMALELPTDTEPYASFKYINENTWEVSLSTGQSTTMYSIPDQYGYYFLFACIESHHFLFSDYYEYVGDSNCAFKAYVTSYFNEYPVVFSQNMGNGRYYGIGHNNPDTGAVFDDYLLEEFRYKNGKPDQEYPDICQSCFCRCYEKILDRKLYITITNATGRASCLNNLGTEMNWVWDMLDPITSHRGTWYGEYLYTRGSYEHLFKWRLSCEEAASDYSIPFDHLILALEDFQPCCPEDRTDCIPSSPIVSMSSCSPSIILTYGPFYVYSSDLACGLCFDPTEPDCMPPIPTPDGWEPGENCIGEYYVTITE